ANSLAQRAALAALGDEEHVAKSRALNHAEMAFVREGLAAHGFQPYPSEANFLCFDVNRDGRAVFEALLREGVIVRHIHGSWIRVTIGLPEENRQFLRALQAVLSRQ
ncbi:MAG: aminotransferase class I/II-fold pyridoxal phosphate-dependent enzyme, partial [Nitrospira sp.]